MTREKALAGTRIVELAEFVAGPYCSKLLADLGAEVVKIERPPRGDPARSSGPFPGDLPHPEKSGLFLYVNSNKLGITLDVGTATGREVFRRLVEHADVLIEDLAPGAMDELGLGYASLKAANPRLIMTSITPFGQTGSSRDYKARQLNVFHARGRGYSLRENTDGGGGIPTSAPGCVVEYDAGLSAAVATLAALFHQSLTGRGQHIDVSKQEAEAALERVELGVGANEGLLRRQPSGSGPGALMRSKDGYVVFTSAEPHQWRAMVELMGNPAWARGSGSVEEAVQARSNWSEIGKLMEAWMAEQESVPLVERGQALGCPIGVVRSPADLLASSQYRARHFFTSVETWDRAMAAYASAPYRFSRTPWALERPAPKLGEHNEEILCGRLGYARRELAVLRGTGIV